MAKTKTTRRADTSREAHASDPATAYARAVVGDNIANFRGFPHMPGNDRAFAYVVGESGENDAGSFFN
jgi:hypothetical protein